MTTDLNERAVREFLQPLRSIERREDGFRHPIMYFRQQLRAFDVSERRIITRDDPVGDTALDARDGVETAAVRNVGRL